MAFNRAHPLQGILIVSRTVRRNLVVFIAALLVTPLASVKAADRPRAGEGLILVEAESFVVRGGWVVDPQFMDTMGSPYLLAHGLGRPVEDAATEAAIPASCTYHVWVRTKDWVAPWKAPGTPGRFQVLFNGRALTATFGTEGAEWHWQDGGQV